MYGWLKNKKRLEEERFYLCENGYLEAETKRGEGWSEIEILTTKTEKCQVKSTGT